jgi:CO/xanthine dehydrogenase Mo-binding subunit
VLRPPHAGARLRAVDAAALRAIAGVHLVREGSFLAVAASDEYLAVRAAARAASAIDWDTGDGLAAGDVFAALRTNPRVSLAVIDGTPVDGPLPPLAPPPADARVSLQAVYERGYQMHAAIGPSAAMALLRAGNLSVWTHSQGIYPLRDSLAETLGMEVARVRVQHVPGAGCYGHNGADDVALDAALVARALPGRHVLLKWSRADEHAWEPYGSAMAVAVSGSIDAAGQVRGWSLDGYSDTHLGRPRPGAPGVGPSRLLATRWLADAPPRREPAPNRGTHSGIHRNADPYYAFGARRIVKHLVRGLPHRTSALRTLGGFMNVFAIECFLDELAHGAGLDPLALRLSHLRDVRAREVLERAARAIGWQAGVRRAGAGVGRGQGLAFARYKNRQAYVAVAVELSVDETARVQLERAVIAADAGHIIDADGLAAQMEGGFLQAASWTLYEAVRYDAGGIASRDWDSYPILRFDNVPRIEVVTAARPDAPPLGAGEAACGPAGAAIANAVFAASGLRVRRLPLTPDALRAAALRD